MTEPNRLDEIVGGKYRIVRFLASGGMGSVYEAHHTVVRRRFAVKFLHHELSLRRELLARFQLEAEAAGALESEHVAAAVDFGIAADGAPYIVLEYLVGESLEHLLEREGRLPVERATQLVQQAARGVQAAHASGIVHRDLKPHNLFVCRREDGTDLVKVLDFGVAKLEFLEKSGAATRTGTVLGTPSYMSPEQARGEKNVDHLSDVYALGAILYELLSGRKPHPGESHNAILHHIATQPPLPLARSAPALPEALVAVVQRALAGNMHDRPASAEEFAVALAPWARAEVWPAPKIEPSAPRHAEPSTTLPAPVSAPNSAGLGAALAVQTSERESAVPVSGTPESIELASRDRKSARAEPMLRRRWGIVLGGAAVLAAAAYLLVPTGPKRTAEPDATPPRLADKAPPDAPTLDALAAVDPHAALAPITPPSANELTTAPDAVARNAGSHVIHAPTAAATPHGSGATLGRAAASGGPSGRPLGRPAPTTAGEVAHPGDPADTTSGLAPVRFDQHNPYTDQKP